MADTKIYGARQIVANYGGLVSHRKRLLVLSVGFGFAAALAEGVGLSLVYPLLDSVVGDGKAAGPLWEFVRGVGVWISGASVVEGLLYLAVVVFFLKSLLLVGSTALTHLWVGRLREDWTRAALGYYLFGPYTAIAAERRGKVMHNVLGEPGSAAKALEDLVQLTIKSVFALVLVATLFVLNWTMTLAVMGVILAGALLARPLMLKPMQRLGQRQLRVKQSMKAIVAEPIFGAGTIKLLGVENSVLKQLGSSLRRFTTLNVLISTFSKAPSDFVEFVVVASVALVFIVLAHGFGISYQEAAPLIGSFAVVGSRLLGVMSSLLSKRMALASVTPTLQLVHSLLNANQTREVLDRGEALASVDSDIEFRDVRFGYDPDTPVLKGLTMTVPRGKMVGLVGPTGVGKSTIGYLLARLYEPDRGRILINDKDIRGYTLRSLRQRIGYVEQNPLIFNGTIEENLRLGAPKVSKEEIVAAAEAAGAHDFIDALPEGYDTPVGDQGATLSGGERQRLAIARAIVRRPDVYIIDEGTSALDRKTEGWVQQSIQKLAGRATVIVIAHRISTLKGADLIYELLPSGEAVERTYEEVAA